jgi:hypothetical protein
MRLSRPAAEQRYSRPEAAAVGSLHALTANPLLCASRRGAAGGAAHARAGPNSYCIRPARLFDGAFQLQHRREPAAATAQRPRAQTSEPHLPDSNAGCSQPAAATERPCSWCRAAYQAPGPHGAGAAGVSVPSVPPSPPPAPASFM